MPVSFTEITAQNTAEGEEAGAGPPAGLSLSEQVPQHLHTPLSRAQWGTHLLRVQEAYVGAWPVPPTRWLCSEKYRLLEGRNHGLL